MAAISLPDTSSMSLRDLEVLEKIKNPETNPSFVPVIDDSKPRDPGCADPEKYKAASVLERQILGKIQKLEFQATINGVESNPELVNGYKECQKELDHLISQYPNYSSARNNRVQLYKRLYGDAILAGASHCSAGLVKQPSESEVMRAVEVALDDLEHVLRQLLPKVYTTPISSQHMRILASVATQRGVLYHTFAKVKAASDNAAIPSSCLESKWTLQSDFESAASRDFAVGGFFGNKMAKELAVAINPTAKLCGHIVSEALRKERGGV